MAETKWVCKARYWIAPKPTLPGVWKMRDGGWLVRGRATDPRTGRMREVLRALDAPDAPAAFAALHRELAAIRTGGDPTAAPARTRFAAYAASLLERKVQAGDIKSAKGREKWGYILEHHLIPAFGDVFMDRLTHGDIQAWRAQVGARIKAGKYSPHTANDWLAVLRVILTAARTEYRWLVNPMEGVAPFDASDHATYTDEEPNALTPAEVPRFLRAMRDRWPQHFAMTALGFGTGLRPSTLRPLRRCGPCADVLWDSHELLVRRSQTVRDEVMNKPKTGKHQRIALPEELVGILRWHVEYQLPEGVPPECELLFPSELGGFRSRSCLDKPFADVAKHLALGKHVSPRAMRRTFQDLCRAAEVHDVVTRSISGHATAQMQGRYSTASAGEQIAALAKVIDLAGARGLARVG